MAPGKPHKSLFRVIPFQDFGQFERYGRYRRVCSDWRYANELRVCQDVLWDLGWRVRTVYVATAGIGPANDEEFRSLCEIRETHSFDQEYVFAPNHRHAIIEEGRRLALSWHL